MDYPTNSTPERGSPKDYPVRMSPSPIKPSVLPKKPSFDKERPQLPPPPPAPIKSSTSPVVPPKPDLLPPTALPGKTDLINSAAPIKVELPINNDSKIKENGKANSGKLVTGGYVGIDSLQEQMRKKMMKRGFEFNIIVVGRSGLGKSTLVNTLFKARVSNHLPVDKLNRTTYIHSVSHVIEENGVQLKLTITDTPGYGDQVNNDQCWVPIVNYINQQYERYLQEEQNIERRKHIPDTRVHCCLYFIEPTGHALKPLDIECMQHLKKCVNIIPVIAKADSLTTEERLAFKRRVRVDLAQHGIDVYPSQTFLDDPDGLIVNNKRISECIPFAVVGSEQQHIINGRTVIGRKTHWGIVEVESRSHCEFVDLRDTLIRTCMQDLVEVTAMIHYENYREDVLKKTLHNSSLLTSINNLNESRI